LPAGSSLTDGLGLDRDYVVSLAGLLPATRFAVEAYVHFVRDKTLLEAVASSLTELFSPQIISERIDGMLKSYDFVSADTLAYFAKRPAACSTRFRFRPRLRQAQRQDPGRPTGRAQGARIQVRRAMGDAGCAL
jgi:coenzyme PQQ biosynthesis protein C